MVEDATEIIVSLNDRREFLAEVVGVDPLSDLAVLKIDGKSLPKVKIGKSEDVKVGDWVVAIGSPFSFDFSVTAGIISAKGRSIQNQILETMYHLYKPMLLLIQEILAVLYLILMAK